MNDDWLGDGVVNLRDGWLGCRRWCLSFGFEPLWTRFHAVFGKPTFNKHSPHPAKREVLRNDCGPVGIFELQQAYQQLARHSGFCRMRMQVQYL